MSNCEIIPADRYSFSKSDRILIDTNIWFFLYGPYQPKDQRSIQYSRIFQTILKSHTEIYTDVLILSEFINRYARIMYQIDQKAGAPADFKPYRKSNYFKPVSQSIANAVRLIMKHSIRINNRFDTIELDKLIYEFQEKSRDFNDQILAELCRSMNLSLLTDDSDFKEYDISIVTVNPKLIQ